MLVVPSLLPEAFGRGVVEANARGIPVVVSTRGGLPELVEAERTGLVFNPDKPGDLGRTLRAFVDGPLDAGAMAHACCEAARSFTADGIAQQHATLYESLVGRQADDPEARQSKRRRDRRSEAVCVIE